MPRQALAKKTPRLPPSPERLPELTGPQFEFVAQFMSGKKAVDAYRAAYPTSKDWDAATIYREAYTVQRHPKISAWISSARRHALFGSERTIEQHKRRLNELQDLSVDAGVLGAAVKAEELIGRVEGHYTETLRIVPGELDITALCRAIETLLGPEQAQIAAQKLGINDFSSLPAPIEHQAGDKD